MTKTKHQEESFIYQIIALNNKTDGTAVINYDGNDYSDEDMRNIFIQTLLDNAGAGDIPNLIYYSSIETIPPCVNRYEMMSGTVQYEDFHVKCTLIKIVRSSFFAKEAATVTTLGKDFEWERPEDIDEEDFEELVKKWRGEKAD